MARGIFLGQALGSFGSWEMKARSLGDQARIER